MLIENEILSLYSKSNDESNHKKQLKIDDVILNNPIELVLRTIYHRLTSSRLFIRLKMSKASKSYIPWLYKKSLQRLNIINFESKPKVTFIIQLTQSNIQDVLHTVSSIQTLNQKRWEVALVTCEKIDLSFPEIITSDSRIKIVNCHQSYLEKVYEKLNCDYVVHCTAGDQFSPTLLLHFYCALDLQPACKLFYFDCDYLSSDNSELHPFFKPTAPSPELLMSINYLTRAFIELEKLVTILPAIGAYSNLNELELELDFRFIESGMIMNHIPEVLVTQKSLEITGVWAEKCISSHLMRLGKTNPRWDSTRLGRRLKWDCNEPSVAIIIPNRNRYKLLKDLIETIEQITDYQNYSIAIVDNDSNDKETIDYYKILCNKPNISLLSFGNEFNYSKAINFGVQNTKSELLLFLNNDMKINDPFWLQELSQWAALPEIGVVGAKLIRANDKIQHAGIILGMNGFMGHLYLNAPEHYNGLLGSADWYRNFYAVTGACQMVRRDLFNMVEGYDEGYHLVFSDVDFCLRIHSKGYRNLYTPFTTLYHYEGKSRGYNTPSEDIIRGYKQMGEFIFTEDPYFSPNLTYSPIPECQISENKRKIGKYDFRKKLLLKHSNN